MINSQQTRSVICSKEEYYDVCIRNGYRVPDIESRLCTIQFLKEVSAG
jgi:hypothetical protein